MNKPVLIIMCASCRRIRDAEGRWLHAGAQSSRQTPGQFSHSICPACLRKLYPEFADLCTPEGSEAENP